MEKLALELGLPLELTRAEEYQLVQKAGQEGYTKTLEDRYSDETVFLVKGQLLNPDVELDTSTPEALEESLKAQGFKVVNLEHWAKEK